MPKDLYNSGRKNSGGPTKMSKEHYEKVVQQVPVCGLKYKSGDAAQDAKMSGDGLASYAKKHANKY